MLKIKSYENLGKLLYCSILFSFLVIYGLSLLTIIIWYKRKDNIILFYPRITLLIVIVCLILWLFYLIRKWNFNRNLFFSLIGTILVYELLILTIIWNKLEIYDVIFYLLLGSILVLCLHMIWISATVQSEKNDKEKPKVLPKR